MTLQTLFPFHFSPSTMSDLWSCEFAFYRKHIQKLRPMAQTDSNLYAGGLFASACEITRKAFFNDKVPEDTAIQLGKTHILEADSTEDDLKSNERLAYVFEKYFQHYPVDKDLTPCELEDGTYAIEYYFDLGLGIPHPDFPDKELSFVGRLDFLGERRESGKTVRYVVDDKTTKAVRRITGTKIPDVATEEKIESTRGQFMAYIYAARAIGVKGINKALIRRVPILATYEKPYEIPLTYTDHALESWFTSTTDKIMDVLERYKWLKANGEENAIKAFRPVYNDACNSYNRPCTYKVGCLHREGEEILAQTCEQTVHTKVGDTWVNLPLKQVLKDLRGTPT